MSRGPARLRITTIYDVVVFLLESAVFAIIGLELPGLVRKLPLERAQLRTGVARGHGDAARRARHLGRGRDVPSRAARRDGRARRRAAAAAHHRGHVVGRHAGRRTARCCAVGAADDDGRCSVPAPRPVAAARDDVYGDHPRRARLHARARWCDAPGSSTIQACARARRRSLGTRRWRRRWRDSRSCAMSTLPPPPPSSGCAASSPTGSSGPSRGCAQSESREPHADRDATTTSEEMRQVRRELINVESARLLELAQAGVISEPVRRRGAADDRPRGGALDRGLRLSWRR